MKTTDSSATTGRKKHFDVIILGSGIAGSVLGSILARHGTSVLILDSAVHPRFAVGESTTLYTLKAFRQLAERYDIPEFEHLTSYEACLAHIGSSFGVKKHFGFMFHQEGQEPDPADSHQFSPPSKALQTSHLHRPDSDSYLFHLAVSYGCVTRQHFTVQDIELGEDSVEVCSADGETFTGRFLVDGSGFRSPIASRLGLREPDDSLAHHSRSLFGHMIDVRPTDDALRMEAAEMPPIPWVQGTMHHMFERGWFWIIPFNNEPRSTNPLVSIGLTLDERLYPRDATLSPEEEFFQHVNRFPVLRRIFENAKSVRPWVSAPRIQYTSSRSVGHRWCMLSHAAGFIDPLYSRGLTNTTEVINALSWRLLDALEEDDFSTDRFQYVDELQKGLIRYNDAMVNCSFISWGHRELWNAVYRVWCAAEVPINLRFDRYIDEFRRTRSQEVFRRMEDVPYPGLFLPDQPEYKRLFDRMVALCGQVEKGERPADEAGRELMDEIRNSEGVLRGIGIEDPERRFLFPGPDDLRSMADWLRHSAPPEMRYMSRGLGGTPSGTVPS